MEIKAFLNIYSTVHRFKTSSDTTLFPRSQTSLFVLKTWAQLSQPTIVQLFDYIALCRKNSWRREKAAIRGRDAFLQLQSAAVSFLYSRTCVQHGTGCSTVLKWVSCFLEMSMCRQKTCRIDENIPQTRAKKGLRCPSLQNATQIKLICMDWTVCTVQYIIYVYSTLT